MLDAKMQEIVDQAIADGDGATAQDIVRVALEDWWGRTMLSGYSIDELKRMEEEITADTRPGRPTEEVFAELKEFCRHLEAEHRAADAA